MKKAFFKYLFIVAVFLPVVFTACDNPFSKQKESSKFVTVSGSLIKTGAFPSELLSGINGRTAFASIPDTGVTYVVKAVNTATGSTETYDGEVSGSSYTIGIPIADTAKNYKITASLIQDNKTILYGESAAFVISDSTPPSAQNKNITLSVQQTAGKTGSVYLEIEVEADSQIAKCKTSLDDYETDFLFSSNKTRINLSGITSGVHSVTFNFYDNNNKLLYFFRDTINVFDNLKTDTWFQNGNEPWFETTTSAEGVKTTKCKITNAMTEDFGIYEIYVDENASGTQSGTCYNPVTSIEDAVAKCIDANKDYTIFIKGTLHGAQRVSSDLSYTAGNTKPYHARSLTICGASAPVDGVPQCVLDGGFTESENGTTLSILSSTGLPVTIKNLKITGGYAGTHSAGGGIANHGQLILDSGSIVEGNHSLGDGGGVVSSGTLILNGGIIKNNSCIGSGRGGAVYNSGTLRINGTSYIPAGTNGKHDVYCTVGGSTGIIVLDKAITLPDAANGLAAKLTPATYARDKTILGSISGATTTVMAEREKFTITPEPGVSPDPGWAIDIAGFIATVGEASDDFILPIEDKFNITGKGPVATGKVESGSLYAGLGGPVDIVGRGQIKHATAIGLEMFQRTISETTTGDNVGVLLSGITSNDFERGMVICKPGKLTNYTKFTAYIYLKTNAEGGRSTDVPQGYRPQIYLRTTDVTGTITFNSSDLYLDGDTQKAALGDNYNVTVELIYGYPISVGQEFPIREGGRTVGTGTVTAVLE